MCYRGCFCTLLSEDGPRSRLQVPRRPLSPRARPSGNSPGMCISGSSPLDSSRSSARAPHLELAFCSTAAASHLGPGDLSGPSRKVCPLFENPEHSASQALPARGGPPLGLLLSQGACNHPGLSRGSRRPGQQPGGTRPPSVHCPGPPGRPDARNLSHRGRRLSAYVSHTPFRAGPRLGMRTCGVGGFVHSSSSLFSGFGSWRCSDTLLCGLRSASTFLLPNGKEGLSDLRAAVMAKRHRWTPCGHLGPVSHLASPSAHSRRGSDVGSWVIPR